MWRWSLVFAGVNDCAMASYHFVLPFHMGWGGHLDTTPTSIVWALYALNFSWSLLVLLTGVLVLFAARMGPVAFARPFVFMVGFFWLIHGAYTWIRPFPMPASLVWLGIVLALFPLLMVASHWAPVIATKRPRT